MFETIKWSEVSRREILKAGTAAAAFGAATPMMAGSAFASAEEDRIVASAKKAAPSGAELTGIMWSNYQTDSQGIRRPDRHHAAAHPGYQHFRNPAARDG
jgi:hypothetical protein